MLVCLRVRQFAIIDAVEITFGSGLNVITGETGAGKSIVVDALELLLGSRGRPELIRSGQDQAEVEALFDVSRTPEISQTLSELDLPESGSELIVRRVLQASGRSRAYVNGRLCTASQLATLTSGLVDISSQHEHHTLVDVAKHLAYLDAYAQVSEQRVRMAEAFAKLFDINTALQNLTDQMASRAEREDLLRYQLGELAAIDVSQEEESELIEQRSRLRHAEKLVTLSGNAEEALYSAEGAACEVIAKVISELQVAQTLDGSLSDLTDRLMTAQAHIEEVARDLGQYTRALAPDPERLLALEDTLDRLSKLKRKYGGSIESMLQHKLRIEAELASFDDGEERYKSLMLARTAAYGSASDLARLLSLARKKSAQRLAQAMTEELASLGMGGATVEVQIAPLEGHGDAMFNIEGARLSATGIDRVEFLISPNVGEPALPLRKVASGGELSRALLAIKRVLADVGQDGTYLFDEVDTGVGGAIAEVIGRKLREVSRFNQVICITHLAQIAVFADSHFQVKKDVVEGRTLSVVETLNETERLEEVARMLGGIRITAQTRAAAKEMLREAVQI